MSAKEAPVVLLTVLLFSTAGHSASQATVATPPTPTAATTATSTITILERSDTPPNDMTSQPQFMQPNMTPLPPWVGEPACRLPEELATKLKGAEVSPFKVRIGVLLEEDGTVLDAQPMYVDGPEDGPEYAWAAAVAECILTLKFAGLVESQYFGLDLRYTAPSR